MPSAPADSSSAMTSLNVMFPGLHPRRIFAVTGTSTAAFTDAMILPQSAGSFISNDPAPLRTTFSTGHPMLMSMASTDGLDSRTLAAALPIISGSSPNIWTATGWSSPVSRYGRVRLSPWTMPESETISVTHMQAPKRIMNSLYCRYE